MARPRRAPSGAHQIVRLAHGLRARLLDLAQELVRVEQPGILRERRVDLKVGRRHRQPELLVDDAVREGGRLEGRAVDLVRALRLVQQVLGEALRVGELRLQP